MAKRSKFQSADLTRSTALANLRRAIDRYPSKAEFARRSGLSPSTVYHWTRPGARSLPAHKSIERAASALNRIHFRPPTPRQAPRYKGYKREELAKIAVWATSAGPEALRSSRMSLAKLERITQAVLTEERAPRIRGERIDTLRRRFVEYVKSHQEEGPSAAMQVAGAEFYEKFRQQVGVEAPREFSEAWAAEMKTLTQEFNYALDENTGGVTTEHNPQIDVKLERRAGQYNTAQPAAFAQVLSYLFDLQSRVSRYFTINIDPENGNITIWQSVEQQPRHRGQSGSKSKSSHRRSRE